MLKIGLDVDNVVEDLVELSLEIFNGRSGNHYTKNDITEYSIHRCIPAPDSDRIMEIFMEKATWDRIIPYRDAQMAVKRLVNAGHQIYFVSACNPKTHEWKSDFLCRTFPCVPRNNHLYVHEKQLLSSLDMLVDDNPANLTGGIYTRVLFNQPWNKSCSEAFYDYRVKDMTEVVELVEKIVEEEYRD